MLQIFVPKLTNRLGYTLNVLFKSILLAEIEITTNEELFCAYEGPKLCYSPKRIGDAPWIKNVSFLFETSIKEQSLHCFDFKGNRAFFPVHEKENAPDLPFDIFAASFFLCSRYEEYLPHIDDAHNRFRAQDSLAFQEGFLDKPLVEIWAKELAAIIEARYPRFSLHRRQFSSLFTIDIDAAYCYKRKGLFRNVMGSIRDALSYHNLDEVRKRWRVLLRHEHDPFDTFDYILHSTANHPKLKLIFFPLVGDYDMYDKNISHHNLEFQDLLKHLNDFALVGIHASYASSIHHEKLGVEIKRLTNILHHEIHHNRFHFLRLSLPYSYERLISNGISHDYTMGYADQVGFRASMSCPYPFFNLFTNAETTLTLHPFCAMDTALNKHMHLSIEEATDKVKHLMDECKAVDGCFSGIWHNENLSDKFGWNGWNSLWEDAIAYHDKILTLQTK